MNVVGWFRSPRVYIVIALVLAVGVCLAAWQAPRDVFASHSGVAAAAPSNRLSFVNSSGPSGAHRAPTASECQLFSRMLDASVPKIRETAADSGNTAGVAALDASAQRSRIWLSKGCPYDSVLGVYPSADGKGGMIRLLDVDVVQTFRAAP